MIKLNSVTYRKGGTDLIRNTTLEVAQREAVCLCGPSGIGKTTLLEIAAGLTKPDSGSITLSSNKIGCAFQDDILVPWLNAMENLLFVSNDAITNAHEIGQKWLETFGLEADMKPTKMSGGMRRRLSLARAFLIDPDILLLDEPFAFLDDKWQAVTADLIEASRKRGAAVLMVSHQVRHMKSLDCRMITIETHPIEFLHPLVSA